MYKDNKIEIFMIVFLSFCMGWHNYYNILPLYSKCFLSSCVLSYFAVVITEFLCKGSHFEPYQSHSSVGKFGLEVPRSPMYRFDFGTIHTDQS